MDRTPEPTSAPSPLKEYLLRRLLAQADIHAFIFLDVDGRVVSWDGAAEKIFGYTDAEVLGCPLDLLFLPEDRARGIPAHELAAARSAGHGEDDRWQMRKDGGKFWASGAVSALHNEQGELVGYGKILRDLTDARIQTQALTNHLESAEKELKRKDALMGVLAHEFRNPLGIIGNALSIQKTGTDDDAKTAAIMRRQVDLLARMVNDLFESVRVKAGKLQLNRQRVVLQDLLRDVLNERRVAAESRRQHLELVMVPGLIPVEVDTDRIHQVFANLIDNAIKYTPKGGHIWVKATIEGDEAVVRVEDDGIGVDENTLPHLFDMFTQHEASRPMAGGGVGLGLFIVKELVDAHGGTVQVRKIAMDRGTEFTVRLQLAE